MKENALLRLLTRFRWSRVGSLILLSPVAIMKVAAGYAAPNSEVEESLIAETGNLPLALRVMRALFVIIPAACALMFFSGFPQGTVIPSIGYFAFSKADLSVLVVLAVLTGIPGLVVYHVPKLSVWVYRSFWRLEARMIASYAALLFLPAFFFQSVFLSRLFVGLLLLPVGAAMWQMTVAFRPANRFARAFPLVFLTMAIIPGFVLPPYYQGIAGWTNSTVVGDTVDLVGYALVNDAGERIWLTHTIFTPVTQVGRFPSAWNSKKDILGPIGPFIMKAYKRAYPLLEKNLMPHQRILGKFAYPPHTYATNLPDHSNFPPERITNVQLVSLTYRQDGTLLDTKVYEDFSVKDGS